MFAFNLEIGKDQVPEWVNLIINVMLTYTVLILFTPSPSKGSPAALASENMAQRNMIQ